MYGVNNVHDYKVLFKFSSYALCVVLSLKFKKNLTISKFSDIKSNTAHF